jgi:hypothetical protein
MYIPLSYGRSLRKISISTPPQKRIGPPENLAVCFAAKVGRVQTTWLRPEIKQASMGTSHSLYLDSCVISG